MAPDDGEGNGYGIAIVIPTLNEARAIRQCLAALAPLSPAEVVVSDGGSGDETCAIATAFDRVRVIAAPLGRGSQLKAGVAVTTAPIIILLHADTILPPDAHHHIRAALVDASIAGGCFRLRFDNRRWRFAFWSWFTRFDSELTSFGDQAFFMRRSALADAGGLADWPLLEDVDLRRRLKRVGRFVKVRASVTTSARRFERVGVLRCQLRNAFILAAWQAGVSPPRLARIYRATQTATGRPSNATNPL